MRDAGEWVERLAGLAPRAWAPDRAAWAEWFAGREEAFETLWLADGIGHGGEAELAAALLEHGPVTLVAPPATALALTPPRLEDGRASWSTCSAVPGELARPVGVTAIGPDPNGVERVLGAATGELPAGAGAVELALDLPVELRNRVGRVQLADGRSAAGVALADDTVRRRKVGLLSGRAGSEAQDLVDPLHYLRNALEPFAEVIEAPLGEMLKAAPDVLVFADVGGLGEAERAELVPWIEAGGLLLRFAGPRLAQSGAGQLEEDPLLPVRLRAGGRSLGGAMSWGAPRRLQPFPEDSPFAGLPVPADVDISSQVMAQPDPDLPERVLASLEDGTPLVTGKPLGEGRVVLFHVTANADWSRLPLSGLFVQMLERLTQSAGGLAPTAETLEGTTWTPLQLMNGFGELEAASMVAGVPGERLAEARPSPETPPGIYASGERRAALNVMRAGDELAPLAALPEGVLVETLERAGGDPPRPVAARPGAEPARGRRAGDACASPAGSAGASRTAAQGAALILAAVAAGRRPPPRRRTPVRRGGALRGEPDGARLCCHRQPAGRRAQRGRAARPRRTLFDRTAIEPADPVAVDLETRRPRALPLPLLADHREPGAAVGRGLCAAERLPALRRHDPLRHPGRGPRGRARRHHPERAGAAAPGGQARHPPARAGAARPCADPDLLPLAGLSRPLGRTPRSGSRRRRRPRRSRGCRSATSTTG